MFHPEFQSQLPIVTALLKQNKVKNAYVFGSVLTSGFNEQSDIDLLINFQDNLDPLEEGTIWWNLHDTLREIFNREVDILVEDHLRNPYFIEEVNEKKQLIYAA
jgi:predicted nucleotidyltransferase